MERACDLFSDKIDTLVNIVAVSEFQIFNSFNLTFSLVFFVYAHAKP